MNQVQIVDNNCLVLNIYITAQTNVREWVGGFTRPVKGNTCL